MAAGKRNRLVEIQHLVDGQDEIGQPVQTWEKFASVYADIRMLRGLESIKAGAETSVAQASMNIGWRTDVTTAMRVMAGATAYQIKAVLPDMAGRKFVDLQCEVIA